MDKRKYNLVEYSCSDDSSTNSDSEDQKIELKINIPRTQNTGLNIAGDDLPHKIRRVAVIHPQVQIAPSNPTPSQNTGNGNPNNNQQDNQEPLDQLLLQQLYQEEPMDLPDQNQSSPYYPYPDFPSPDENNFGSQQVQRNNNHTPTSFENPIVISSSESGNDSGSDDEATLIYTPPRSNTSFNSSIGKLLPTSHYSKFVKKKSTLL